MNRVSSKADSFSQVIIVCRTTVLQVTNFHFNNNIQYTIFLNTLYCDQEK